MKREVKGLYAQCFQFAFDVAKKAERALQHELGDPSLTYLQFGYLAGKEGLLAGEKLYLDLKRMEMAYLRPEPARVRADQARQPAPGRSRWRCSQLRATGRCTVRAARGAVRHGRPGPLLPAHQDRWRSASRA